MTEAVSKERTRNYLHQIKGAVVYRAVAMLASFVAIPLMIGYLGQEQFGVWSTLLTVMSWIVLFDLGIGNGLRNKVAESLAKNERIEAGSYIASGYTLIGLIAAALWVLGTAGSYFVPWQRVFNTQAIPESTLRETVQIATFFIVLNFWIGLIAALLGALQRTSLVALGQLGSNLLVLALVFVLTKTTNASITHLALVYGLSIVTANILLSLWFYRNHPELRPRPHLDQRHVRPLLTVGLQFFAIQIAYLVIFTTDKMLITQLFGPQYVTQYEVVFKLFSVITFAHGLVSAPLWSAYTDAYHRGDFDWIRHMLRKQLMVFGCIIVALFTLVGISKPVIMLWIGGHFEVPLILVISVSTFVLASSWVNIFAFFLNGVQKIRLSFTVSIFAMIFNIPVSIALAKYTSLGVSSIIFGTICALLPGVFLGPLQTMKIINKRATGIWAK